MIVENLFKSIDKGRSGLNSGLSSGFKKLDKLVFGVQRQWMTVWAGDSGRGNITYKLIYIQLLYNSSGKIIYMIMLISIQTESLIDISISAVYMSNYIDYYRAKTTKTEMLMSC